jgi:hypothetical protein
MNAAGQPLLDSTTLNAVLVLMLVTSTLGPVLTERLAPHMIEREAAMVGPEVAPDHAVHQ